MFYAAAVDSVLTFGMTCWGGNASKQGKNRLDEEGGWGGWEKAWKHRHSSSWLMRHMHSNLNLTIDTKESSAHYFSIIHFKSYSDTQSTSRQVHTTHIPGGGTDRVGIIQRNVSLLISAVG